MKLAIALTTLGLFAGAVNAAPIEWMTWSGSTGPVANLGTAAGGFSGLGVGVTYAGELDFAQTGNVGTDYWRDNTSTPFPAYTSGSVSNVPLTVDLVAIQGLGIVNTVTFSQPVTNPYMAIVSLGQTSIGTTYYFDQHFSIDSVGAGYWGNGTLTNGGANIFGGDTLVGFEGHGIIQFIGTFTTLSWTSSSGEHWNGFTFGLVPTPGAGAALGLGGLAALRRRR